MTGNIIEFQGKSYLKTFDEVMNFHNDDKTFFEKMREAILLEKEARLKAYLANNS